MGLGTYEATLQVFDYDELKAATLKGKSEPVRVFWAKSSRARFGTDLTRTHDTPFVGREIDLERTLPFPLLRLDSDYGSEFINAQL